MKSEPAFRPLLLQREQSFSGSRAGDWGPERPGRRPLTEHAADARHVGRIMAGRYRIETLLGRGAMGEVYRAHDLRRNQPCAIKLVYPGAMLSLKAERRFLQEAEVVARLFHPNIVEVREFCVDPDGTHFLVMELLTGEDLYGLICRGKRLPVSRVIEILRGVGAALQYAHDLGIVHRDIKPNNIFLCRRRTLDGHEIETVKVLDFGLAKLNAYGSPGCEDSEPPQQVDAPPLTQGLIIGTPAYLAPEATLAGGRFVEARSDQWSLAVIAYEMLAGRLPFPNDDPYQLCLQIRHEAPVPLQLLSPDLPPHICATIDVALSKERGRRFAKVQDFIRALENLPPIAAGAPSSGTASVRTADRGSRTGVGRAIPSAPPRVPAPMTTPHFVEPERTHLPALRRTGRPSDPPEMQRTVQYSAEDLLSLTQQSATGEQSVPTPLTEKTPTRRYEVLAPLMCTESAPSLIELRADAETAAPASQVRPSRPPPTPSAALIPRVRAPEPPAVEASVSALAMEEPLRVPEEERPGNRLLPAEGIRSSRKQRSGLDHLLTNHWARTVMAGPLLICGLCLICAVLLGIRRLKPHSIPSTSATPHGAHSVTHSAPPA